MRDSSIIRPAQVRQLPRTGQTTVYRAGDDGTHQAGMPLAAAQRFVDRGDGTILDLAFHPPLQWVKQPELIIPGAPGVHPTNQVQRVGPNYGSGVGVWVTGSDYLAADLVTTGGLFYVCATAHTSGVFATDLAAGKWRQTVWTASAADLLTPATMDWNAAIDACEELVYAGYSDWRIPNTLEMACLVNVQKITPTASTDAPFGNCKTSPYWGGNTYKSLTTYAWRVDFGVAGPSIALKTTATYYVRPVRGGKAIA